MKNNILINKREFAILLGGISESMVLRLIRNKKLPCKRLTRGTIFFEPQAVQKWTETRPVLRKTWKQQEETKRRRVEAEKRKQEREESRRRYEKMIAERQQQPQPYTSGQQQATA